MSYILDALKKNEVEDNPAVAAEALVQRQSQAHSRRKFSWIHSWIPWAIGAVLLINLTGLTWYLLSGDGQESNRPDQNPALTNPNAQRELVMAPRRQPSTSGNAPLRNNSDLPRRVPNRTAVPVTPPQRTAPARSAPSRVAPARSAPKPAPKRTTGNGRGRVLSPEEARQLGLGTNNTVAQAEVAPATSAAPSAPSAAPSTAIPPVPQRKPSTETLTVDALPSGARSDFPKLEFSTHIFADDPSMRAVVVNDKRLAEGEQFGELVLRAVTEEGVVFGYRGHLVEVSIADAWAIP